MLECLVNGELSDRVLAADRGFQYGDGLFETLPVLKGKPRFWQAHMERLAAGCEQLGLPATPQAILFREVQTVSAGHRNCVVKIMITRGTSGRGYAPGSEVRTNRVVCAYAWPDDPGNLVDTGIRARICSLRLGLQPALAGLKHMNRLEQVMAKAEWDDKAIHEGILLDTEDHVISAISSNIFLVYGENLLTPRVDRCGVLGVMRANILDAFKSRSQQRRILLDMLPDADEVFVCNSVRGIFPVTRIDHWKYPIGPVTREIQQWLGDNLSPPAK